MEKRWHDAMNAKQNATGTSFIAAMAPTSSRIGITSTLFSLNCARRSLLSISLAEPAPPGESDGDARPAVLPAGSTIVRRIGLRSVELVQEGEHGLVGDDLLVLHLEEEEDAARPRPATRAAQAAARKAADCRRTTLGTEKAGARTAAVDEDSCDEGASLSKAREKTARPRNAAPATTKKATG